MALLLVSDAGMPASPRARNATGRASLCPSGRDRGQDQEGSSVTGTGFLGREVWPLGTSRERGREADGEHPVQYTFARAR